MFSAFETAPEQYQVPKPVSASWDTAAQSLGLLCGSQSRDSSASASQVLGLQVWGKAGVAMV